jgi:pimeloyl-ACP methyl ester carboxylesterase
MVTSTLRTIDLGDGDTTTLEQWGESGPAIVCVHGIGSSRKDWLRTAEALAGSFRVFAYDQRGHGDSAAIAGPMTHERSVLDLVAVAEAISGGVTALIGHSWGGAIVIKGGRRVDVKRVIAIDPLIHAAMDMWAADFVDDLVPLFAKSPDDRVPEIRAMFAGATPDVIDGTIEPIVALGAENRADTGGWDLREDVRGYAKPLLLMLADPAESVVSATDVNFVRVNGGPHVTVDVFEGGGHTLHRSMFDRYITSAEAFLRAT